MRTEQLAPRRDATAIIISSLPWALACVGLLLVSVASALPPGFHVETMVSGLDNPVAFAFAPDGRVFVNERLTGRIRVVEDGVLLPEPLATVAVSPSGERGLLGIAIDPDFEHNRYIYVLHSRTPTLQRITRFTAEGNRGIEGTVIWDGIPAAVIHNGGNLHFGPDGRLYLSVGDTGRPVLARRVRALPGKIHRIDPDGSVPEDNPWPGSTAFCIGCRNSFDFTFHPDQVPVVIYAAENGPTRDDEINRVTAGADCGWPAVTGMAGRRPFTDPIHSWSPTTAPVGIVFYRGWNFPLAFDGDLLVAEYTTGRILRIDLDEEGARVLATEVLLEEDYGPLYGLGIAPDGTLWFSTNDALHRVVCDTPPQRFRRGDVDTRSGINHGDVALLISYVRTGVPIPLCIAAADINDDAIIDLNDVATLLGFLNGAVAGLAPPYPGCGLDPRTKLPCAGDPPCE
ncbi:MAG: PQQ-dependent sugar dehydrogenase [Planctomycetota bacterium]